MDKSAEPTTALANKTADPPAPETKTHILETKTFKFINRTLKILAYPIALGSGIWMMYRSTRDDTYQNAERYGAFKDIKQQFVPLTEKNFERRLSNEITKAEFLENAHDLRKQYSKAVEERLAHYGLGNRFVEFPVKWSHLKVANQQKAIFDGLTVAGIALGTLLTVTNSKVFIELFSGNDEKKDNGR